MKAVSKYFATIAATLLSSALLAQAPVVDISQQQGRRSADQATSNANPSAELYFQVQQLQQEMMLLRGIIEEQGHELRQLRQQNLERYIDLDRRLGAMDGGSGRDKPASASTPAPAAASDEELQDYRAAYQLLQQQQFPQAVQAFKGFIEQYPNSARRADAWYWLGELYLVSDPVALDESRKAFEALLKDFSDSNRAPLARYKLGTVYFMSGNRDRARQVLNEVQQKHAGTPAAEQARKFLSDNF